MLLAQGSLLGAAAAGQEVRAAGPPGENRHRHEQGSLRAGSVGGGSGSAPAMIGASPRIWVASTSSDSEAVLSMRARSDTLSVATASDGGSSLALGESSTMSSATGTAIVTALASSRTVDSSARAGPRPSPIFLVEAKISRGCEESDTGQGARPAGSATYSQALRPSRVERRSPVPGPVSARPRRQDRPWCSPVWQRGDQPTPASARAVS